MRIEAYLETLTGQIRQEHARKPIEEELRTHLEDQTEAYIMEGMSEEEAEESAVAGMGDPVETGLSLDQIHRPVMPWKAIVLFMLIGLAGLGIQYLTVHMIQNEINGMIDFRKQFLYLLIGFAVMIVVCYLDYGILVNYAAQIIVIIHFLIQFGSEHFGETVCGMTQWIDIGIKINTPMVTLLFIPLYGALLCQGRGNGYLMLILDLAMMIFPVNLMIRCPSMMTILILGVSFSFLLTLAVCRGWYRVAKGRVLVLFWGMAAAGLAVLVKLQSKNYGITRLHRLFGVGEGESYMLGIVRDSLKGARWIGEGSYANSEALPLSDYMLTRIISEFGIAAGIVIILLLAGLVVFLFRNSFRQSNECGRMLSIACATAFLAQFLLYAVSNLGLISVTGYCPILTYGGNGTVVTYLLLGLLLCVQRMDPVMSLYKTGVPEPEKREEDRASVIKGILAVAVLCAVLAAAA